MILILGGEKGRILNNFANYVIYNIISKIFFVDIPNEMIYNFNTLLSQISDLGKKYIVIGFNSNYFDPLNIVWIYWRGYSLEDALSVVVHLRYFIDGYEFFLPAVLIDSVYEGSRVRVAVREVIDELVDKECERRGKKDGFCVFAAREGEVSFFATLYKEFLRRYLSIVGKN